MTPFLLRVAIVIAIALGIGTWSAINAIENSERIAAIRFNDWVAFPHLGTEQTDPYSRARIAREGTLPLGAAEGLSFSTKVDSSGDPLSRRCDYRLEGSVPTGRFWTLFAATPTGRPLRMQRVPQASALHSDHAIWQSRGVLVVNAGPDAAPGNWLGIDGDGPMMLVLNVYDTPVATNVEFADVAMPRVEKVACRG